MGNWKVLKPGYLNGPVPSGTTVGYWTVLEEAPRQHGLRHLRCRCECGTERDVCIGALRTGNSTSCGCHKSDRVWKHGLWNTREYSVWRQIIQRCHNPKSTEYHNYGARGIQVCEQWRRSFATFIADVGRRPSPELSIDRINNDGHYEPGNVRWATRTEQARNTRISHDERVRRGRINAMKRWHGAA